MALINKIPEFFYHLPLIQTFVNISYFLQLMEMNGDLQEITDKHEDFSSKYLDQNEDKRMETMEQTNKDLNNTAKKFYEIKLKQKEVYGYAKNLKSFEAVFEAAPQSVLQLYIFFVRDGANENINLKLIIATIISSFLVSTYGSSGIFLSLPTKVNQNNNFYRIILICIINRVQVIGD